MINTEFRSHLKKTLNTQQYEAVIHDKGAMLLLAGAGSGKTHTIVCRMARLIGDGVPPDRILALTFTNKAALEMKKRVKKISKEFGFDSTGLQVFTFHGFAFNHIKVISRQHFKEMSEAKLDVDWSLLELVVKEEKRKNRKIYYPRLSHILLVISKSLNSLKDIEEVIFSDFPALENQITMIEHIKEIYEEEKKKLKYIDFNDLLIGLKLSLQDLKYFKASVKRLYDYVIVDEYQDTNIIQDAIIYDIVNLIKSNQESPRTDNVMAVGDDSQSIYSFHGADHENILKFPDKYRKCKIVKLEQNYRSTKFILNFANDVINNSKFSNNALKKEMFSVAGNGEKPLIQIFFNKGCESAWVSRKIESLMFANNTKAANIAVLFRASHYSFDLEVSLRSRGIGYKKYGGLDFFSKAHIKDILSFLSFAFYEKDSLPMMRVLNLIPGVGTVKSQEIIQNIYYKENLPVIAKHYSNTKIYELLEKIEKAVHLIRRDRSPVNLEKLYEIYFEFLGINYSSVISRRRELESLARIAKTFPDLKIFYDSINSPERGEIDKEENLEKNNKITLSTVHSAKGLEWDIVFIIGAMNESFPSSQALSAFAMTEELRLMYVATTRPKKELYISYIGQMSDNKPYEETMSKLLKHIRPVNYKIIF